MNEEGAVEEMYVSIPFEFEIPVHAPVEQAS